MGICNPHPVLFDVTLMSLVQGLKHVNVPLTKLMHPFRDQMCAVRISNHVVKTTLIEMSQCQKNKEIIKEKHTIRGLWPLSTMTTRGAFERPSDRNMKNSIARRAGQTNSKRSTVDQRERLGELECLHLAMIDRK